MIEPTLLAKARDLVAGAHRVVALTGAGISTRSGIPDFRGADGTWTHDPDAEKLSTLSFYLHDDEVRRKAWQSRLASSVWKAQPNAAHHFFVELERLGKLSAVVTQNTDGLHTLAGNKPMKVLEMHGNVRRYRCERCHATGPMEDVLSRLHAGETDPRCERELDAGPGHTRECGGILRATTILFEEALPSGVLDSAIDAVSACDVLICVGSTLSVYPVAGLVPLAERVGASIIIINLEPTSYDRIADVVLPCDATDILPLLLPAAPTAS